MLRTIREIHPGWVVGENVRGLTNWNGGVVFDEVQADLEAEGYEVLPFLLPAAGIGAPHKRYRIFFVAHAEKSNDKRNERKVSKSHGGSEFNHLSSSDQPGDGLCGERITANSNCIRYGTVQQESGNELEDPFWNKGIGEERNVTNATQQQEREQADQINVEPIERGAWTEFGGSGNRWARFPTQSPICGGNDGIPDKLDRIAALGNAVVPQIIFQIFKAIEAIENIKR